MAFYIVMRGTLDTCGRVKMGGKNIFSFSSNKKNDRIIMRIAVC